MGHRCDFCGEQRAIVYCRSDAASLCLSCDRNVHSANALSRRHSRTLLCERCSDQPASFRCVSENASLCQNCDWTAHSTSALPTSHERQPIYGYTGCPSAEELSRIWSFVLDESSREDYACHEKMGLMSIEENTVSDYSVPRENNNNTGDHDSNAGQLGTWTGSCSSPVENPGQRGGNQFSAQNPMQRSGNQFAGSGDSTTNKPSCLGLKGFELDEDDICNDFDVADCEMAFENYEELFGVCQNNPEQDIVNSGIDSLFGARDMSAVDSGGQGGSFPEGSAAGKFKLMQSACSDQVSGDSAMSAKTEPNFCYSGRPAQSNISFSFSGLGGDSGDYQDSGVSSMLLMDEPSWLPPGAESSFPSANRDSAVMRYKEKKKARKFEKKIRYESRKARADVRKRVKGRFVKAGDAYDYDPLCQTRSC